MAMDPGRQRNRHWNSGFQTMVIQRIQQFLALGPALAFKFHGVARIDEQHPLTGFRMSSYDGVITHLAHCLGHFPFVGDTVFFLMLLGVAASLMRYE